jgi:hypothetical protein
MVRIGGLAVEGVRPRVDIIEIHWHTAWYSIEINLPCLCFLDLSKLNVAITVLSLVLIGYSPSSMCLK